MNTSWIFFFIFAMLVYGLFLFIRKNGFLDFFSAVFVFGTVMFLIYFYNAVRKEDSLYG